VLKSPVRPQAKKPSVRPTARTRRSAQKEADDADAVDSSECESALLKDPA
jgi:hypothetical protein